LAIERGIHFEFTYGSAIRDASSRRYLFSNVLSLLRLTRGRNLVLSSALGASRGGGGAGNEQLLDLRAPWDVINLAVMLGIEASVAKATVSAHARAVLLHAEARKTIKCVLREVKLDAEPQQQQQQPQPSSSPSAATAGAASSSSAAAGSGSTTGRSKPARDDNEGPKQKKGKFQK
jgi:ribonuclease P/MRP protein subunit RPP1